MGRLSGLAAGLPRAPAAPDGLDEWLILETLLGTWPISADAARRLPDQGDARGEAPYPLGGARAGLRGGGRSASPARSSTAMRASPSATRSPPRCAGSNPPARMAGIGQTILQLAVPGIADIYQGTEFWDHSLVDPDNRRPVDWTAREEALAGGVWIDFADDAIGLAKFRTLRRLLALRRANPDLVAEGRYEPVAVTEGPARFVAFLRRWPTGSLLVAVPTRPTRLAARERSSPACRRGAGGTS